MNEHARYWPIHCADWEHWIACDYPERPPVLGETGFHYQCRACSVALDAIARTDPDVEAREWWQYAAEVLRSERPWWNAPPAPAGVVSWWISAGEDPT